MIRSFLRISAVALVACVFAACSSDDSPQSVGDAGPSSGGAGGKGGGQSGKTGTGGEEAGAPACTTADAGADNCRLCLARYCCSDLTECLGDSLCSKSLTTHEECFRTPGQEISTCFGDLTRALEGDAGSATGLPPIPICIITHCSVVCGGPGVV